MGLQLQGDALSPSSVHMESCKDLCYHLSTYHCVTYTQCYAFHLRFELIYDEYCTNLQMDCHATLSCMAKQSSSPESPSRQAISGPMFPLAHQILPISSKGSVSAALGGLKLNIKMPSVAHFKFSTSKSLQAQYYQTGPKGGYLLGTDLLQILNIQLIRLLIQQNGYKTGFTPDSTSLVHILDASNMTSRM